ncbi:MAG: response regulator transcription factor [Spirochaetales bacterium]|nr:response regulator transcription factor [Spirochaetales bacterium]
MKKKILLCEDELAIRTGLEDLLESENYKVVSASDGQMAMEVYRKEEPDLILLDIMMPELSGYDVLKKIRRNDPVTPILMLTAKSEEIDKILGLELGADDYITKPFGLKELLARVKAALRRASLDSQFKENEIIRLGDLEVNPSTFEGKKGKVSFKLTLREVRLLQFFIKNPNKVLDRFTLLDEVWGINYEGTTRTLDQHIAKLRQKIESNPSDPRLIQTVHTVGYRFCG